MHLPTVARRPQRDDHPDAVIDLEFKYKFIEEAPSLDDMILRG